MIFMEVSAAVVSWPKHFQCNPPPFSQTQNFPDELSANKWCLLPLFRFYFSLPSCMI